MKPTSTLGSLGHLFFSHSRLLLHSNEVDGGSNPTQLLKKLLLGVGPTMRSAFKVSFLRF